MLWLSHDYPVVTDRGNRSIRRKPPSNPKSLATFSHALVDRGSNLGDGERQLAVAGNTLDPTTVRAGLLLSSNSYICQNIFNDGPFFEISYPYQ